PFTANPSKTRGTVPFLHALSRAPGCPGGVRRVGLETDRRSTAAMPQGRSQREQHAGSKVEIVRTALAVVRAARRASRLRVARGSADPARRRSGAPPRLRIVRKRG